VLAGNQMGVSNQIGVCLLYDHSLLLLSFIIAIVHYRYRSLSLSLIIAIAHYRYRSLSLLFIIAIAHYRYRSLSLSLIIAFTVFYCCEIISLLCGNISLLVKSFIVV